MHQLENIIAKNIPLMMATKTITHLGINFQKFAKPKSSKPQNLGKSKKEHTARYTRFLNAKSQECKNINPSTN